MAVQSTDLLMIERSGVLHKATADDLTGSHTHTKADITDFNDADYATAAEGDLAATAQQPPVEGAFVDGDKTKLNGIEASADVTDTANVTAAGALMDSEVTNLAAVKAFNPADYATSAQGSLADTAAQPDDIDTFVESDPTGITGADVITNIVSLTQAEYDAIGTPDASTVYVVT